MTSTDVSDSVRKTGFLFLCPCFSLISEKQDVALRRLAHYRKIGKYRNSHRRQQFFKKCAQQPVPPGFLTVSRFPLCRSSLAVSFNLTLQQISIILRVTQLKSDGQIFQIRRSDMIIKNIQVTEQNPEGMKYLTPSGLNLRLQPG